MKNYLDFFAPPYSLDLTKRERQETWYRNARYCIIVSTVLTVLSTVLSLFEPHPFHFSIIIPHTLIVCGYLSSGRAPADICEAYDKHGFTVPLKDDSALMLAIVCALFVMFLFLICWYRSKDYHVGWLIAALMLTVIDSAAMFVIHGLTPVGIVFHAGVIALLAVGIRAHFKLKKMPPDFPNQLPLDELK